MSAINSLTRIEFGEGELARLPEFLAALGIKRPLFATDQGLVASGLVERGRRLVGDAAVIFDETPANPTEDAVNAAFALYKSSGCDGIVGMGGGSSLDLAKAWARENADTWPGLRIEAVTTTINVATIYRPRGHLRAVA